MKNNKSLHPERIVPIVHERAWKQQREQQHLKVGSSVCVHALIDILDILINSRNLCSFDRHTHSTHVEASAPPALCDFDGVGFLTTHTSRLPFAVLRDLRGARPALPEPFCALRCLLSLSPLRAFRAPAPPLFALLLLPPTGFFPLPPGRGLLRCRCCCSCCCDLG